MDNIVGAYYLHSDGSLIWKSKNCFCNITLSEYFDSPFVKKYWIFWPEFKTGNYVVEFLQDAYKNGAKKEEIIRIAQDIEPQFDKEYLNKVVFI